MEAEAAAAACKQGGWKKFCENLQIIIVFQ
jgi:hypothetical protein